MSISLPLTASQLECIQQTNNPELSWKSDRLSPAQAQTRDIFFQLVRSEPVNSHRHLLEHPFWNKWKSSKSGDQKNMLFFAAQEAQDIGWVEALIDMGLVEGHGKYAVFSIFNRKSDDVVPLLKMFSSHVPLDLEGDPQVLRGKVHTVSVLRKALSFGKWDAVEYLITNGWAPTRPHEIEKSVFTCRNLRSASRNIFHDEALDVIWNHWGLPPADQLRAVFKTSLLKSKKTVSIRRGIDRLTEVWNPSHDEWGVEDSASLLSSYLVSSFAREFLEHKIQKGWRFPDKHWQEAFPPEMLDVYEGSHLQEYVLKLFALRDQAALSVALKDNHESCSKRKSKI